MSDLPSMPRRGRRRLHLGGKLSSSAAYILMASIIGLTLFASGTPSPLYETYRTLWGFSSVVLTLVYATYAFGVLASLLLAGAISDRVGRRPVLIVALAALMLTTVVFMAADSLAWLFVARATQGLATGLALGAAGAALLDLHPRRDSSAVGLANGVLSTGGIGLGMLVSALITEVLPAPRVLPYVAAFVLGDRVPGLPGHARTRGVTLWPVCSPPATKRAACRAGRFHACCVGSGLLVIDRGPVPGLGSAAVGDAVSLQRPSGRRSQRSRPRRTRLAGADRVPAYHAVERQRAARWYSPQACWQSLPEPQPAQERCTSPAAQ
jgi:MFS family permease